MGVPRADHGGVQPLSGLKLFFMGKFRKINVNCRKKHPLLDLNPPQEILDWPLTSKLNETRENEGQMYSEYNTKFNTSLQTVSTDMK